MNRSRGSLNRLNRSDSLRNEPHTFSPLASPVNNGFPQDPLLNNNQPPTSDVPNQKKKRLFAGLGKVIRRHGNKHKKMSRSETDLTKDLGGDSNTLLSPNQRQRPISMLATPPTMNGTVKALHLNASSLHVNNSLNSHPNSSDEYQHVSTSDFPEGHSDDDDDDEFGRRARLNNVGGSFALDHLDVHSNVDSEESSIHSDMDLPEGDHEVATHVKGITNQSLKTSMKVS